jgi:hypothetical protein
MQKLVRKKDRRRHSRSTISKMVPILWEDDKGKETLVQGRLMDVSVSGARMWLPVRIPARAPISFNCPSLSVGGRGTVRYCNQSKGGYEIGLELTNGTGWRDQNTDLQNLAAGLGSVTQAPQEQEATEPAPVVARKIE